MGTAICGRCGAWINDQSWRCRSCGRLLPGFFGQRRYLDVLFSRSRSQTRLLLFAIACFYVFELFLSTVTPVEGQRPALRLDDPGAGAIRAGALMPWDPAASRGLLLYDHIDEGLRASHSTREEPWRVATAMLLHGGILHIVMNGLALLSLGLFIESVFGPARFWTVFVLTGVAGNVAMAWFSSSSYGVGASGGLFGMMGSMLAFGVRRGGTWGAEIRQAILRALLLNVVISLMPGISFSAHAGGLVAGFALTYAFKLPDGRGGRESDAARLVALGCVVLLVVSTIAMLAAALHWGRG